MVSSLYTHNMLTGFSSKNENMKNTKTLMMHKPVWVNFMKAGEWNPSHSSLRVMYLVLRIYKYHRKLIEENTECRILLNKVTHRQLERIEFRYGEEIGYLYYWVGNDETKSKRYIWLFPARPGTFGLSF